MGSRSTPSERCWASAMMTVCCCVPEGCQRPCTTQAAESTFCSVLECQARCQLSELFSMPSLSMPCGDMQSVHLCSMMCRRSLLLTLASAALEQQLNDSSNLMISAPCIPDLYQPVSPCSSSGPTSMGLMKC
eukprot:jgi/Astpho2/7413/Aster-01998